MNDDTVLQFLFENVVLRRGILHDPTTFDQNNLAHILVPELIDRDR
jgi:hypothetical protein